VAVAREFLEQEVRSYETPSMILVGTRSGWGVQRSELGRASTVIARASSFLSDRWNDLEPQTRDGLLQTLDEAAEQLHEILSSHVCSAPDAGIELDEILAARVCAL
jgi:hypothetical protein